MDSEVTSISHKKAISPESSFSTFDLFLRNARIWMAIILILSDAIWIIFSNLIALFLRSLSGTSFFVAPYLEYFPAVIFFIVFYASRGQYSKIGNNDAGELYDLSMTTTISFLIIGALTYFLKSAVVYSRLVFGISWVLVLILVPLGRMLTRLIFSHFKLWGIPVIVIGSAEGVSWAVKYFKGIPRIGLRPFAQFIADMPCSSKTDYEAPYFKDLEIFCKKYKIRTGVVVCPDLNVIEQIRDQYRDVFEQIVLINGDENNLRLSGVIVNDFGTMPAIIIRQNLLNPWAQRLKSVIDRIFSGLGLFFLSPALALIAVIIKLDSPGEIFYSQERVGRNGKLFKMYKFRTMHINADQKLKIHLEREPLLKQEWETYQKLKNDPRITWIGKLLRRYSLDELPQLWNVLKGEMSLVGPRPIMVSQQLIYGPHLEHYFRVAPGITGIWQISGRNSLTFKERTEYDLKYVMNWSAWLDIYIMIRTFWTVIRHYGAN